MATELRIKRTESIIRDMVSQMILRGEIKDRRVSTFVSITEVALSKDLDHAKIYVTSYDAKTDQKAVDGLNSAAGFIQRKLGQKLRQRLTPKLQFLHDDALDKSMVIEELLESISHHDSSDTEGSSDSAKSDTEAPTDTNTTPKSEHA